MLPTAEIHNFCMARTEGEVNLENKQLVFRQSATTVENSSNIYFKLFFITKSEEKTQGKVGSYTARRPMTSRHKNEH